METAETRTRKWAGLWLVCALFGVVLLAQAALAQSRPGERGFVYPNYRGPASSAPGRVPGFELSARFGALTPEATFRAATASGTQGLDWSGDGLDEDPFVPGLDITARIAAGPKTRWTLAYEGIMFSAYPSGLTRSVASGASLIPAGSDLDIEVQIHRTSFQWAGNLAPHTGPGGASGAVWLGLGLGWDSVTVSIDSDAFPVSQPKHRFREMLPYPVVSLGWELRWSRDVLRLGAEASMLPETGTLQKHSGSDIKQETVSYSVSAGYDWRLGDAVSLALGARWLHLEHRMTATSLDREVEVDGPQAVLGFSFRF